MSMEITNFEKVKYDMKKMEIFFKAFGGGGK